MTLLEDVLNVFVSGTLSELMHIDTDLISKY